MKYVTIKDIANLLLLSPSTVSRALSGDKNIRTETREKVVEAAKNMGYRPNPIAQNLKRGRTNTIGVIVPEIVTPFFSQIIEGIQRILYPKGIKMIFAQSGEDPQCELRNLIMMENFMVDGIIIGVCHKSSNKSEYKRIADKGIPLVFFDRIPEDMDCTKVIVDDYLKSFFLVEHLIHKGIEQIVHIKGPDHLHSSNHRHKGYKDALQKFNIPYDTNLVINSEKMTFEEGKNTAKLLLDKNIPFQAIFAFTDTIAIGAMNYLKEQNILIPEEVAIASFSGTILSQIVSPALTTVEQPLLEMGKAAAELVIEKIKKPFTEVKTHILDAKTIFRNSTEGYIGKK